MRNIKTYKRDSYLLDLAKEASMFLVMATALFPDYFMVETGLFGIVFLAIVFMFIPRNIINDVLDRDENGNREQHKAPEWKIKACIFLQLTKFVCLIIFVLYIFMHDTMMAFGGHLLWFVAASFMVIPRKLIYMIIKDAIEFEKKEANL